MRRMVIVRRVALLSLSSLCLTPFPFDSQGTCFAASAHIPYEGALMQQITRHVLSHPVVYFYKLI